MATALPSPPTSLAACLSSSKVHEKQLREAAAGNSKMEWLHVGMTGLSGKCHPMMDGVDTAREVLKLMVYSVPEKTRPRCVTGESERLVNRDGDKTAQSFRKDGRC